MKLKLKNLRCSMCRYSKEKGSYEELKPICNALTENGLSAKIQ